MAQDTRSSASHRPATRGVRRRKICILASIEDGSYQARAGSTKPVLGMGQEMYNIVSPEYRKYDCAHTSVRRRHRLAAPIKDMNSCQTRLALTTVK